MADCFLVNFSNYHECLSMNHVTFSCQLNTQRLRLVANDERRSFKSKEKYCSSYLFMDKRTFSRLLFRIKVAHIADLAKI